MAIKYNRDEEPLSLENVPDRWGDPRRSPKVIKRRLLYINMGVLMVTVLLFLYAVTSGKHGERMLPRRPGEGTVVAKAIEETGGRKEYYLDIAVAVPPAEPHEAKLVPEDVENREERIGALTLTHRRAIDPAAWDYFTVGQSVDVMYQIDVSRTKVFVSDVRPRD
jgi:hypothetical protein